MTLVAFRPKHLFVAALCALSVASSVVGCGDDRKPLPAQGTGGTAYVPIPTASFALATWGTEQAQVGHDSPEEGAPDGPQAALVDAAGYAYVLDAVNQRIQRYQGGAYVSSIPLPDGAYEDMDLDGTGFVLLDIYQQAALVFVDSAGALVRTVPLAGSGITPSTTVTAVFRRNDGVWIETDDAGLLRITDAAGLADPERPAAAGRFTAAGDSVIRAIADRSTSSVGVYRQPLDGGESTLFARASFDGNLAGVTGVESSPDGRFYLGVVVEQVSTTDPAVADKAEHVIVVFDGKGTETGRAVVPQAQEGEDVFRPMRLGGDGKVYVMRYTDQGVEIVKVTP